jgi:hypothetical protein
VLVEQDSSNRESVGTQRSPHGVSNNAVRHKTCGCWATAKHIANAAATCCVLRRVEGLKSSDCSLDFKGAQTVVHNGES